ncbi:MAG TPA: hypothetical protein VHF23_00495 [Gaiellaceae bacterium]|nr:hypothetical protein [Gaiellaceae bacterium]
MRRTPAVLASLVAAVVLAGCSGTDAQRAQELLQQSSAALQGVESFRFAGRLWLSGPNGEELSLVLRGATTRKGAGASYVTVRADGVPDFPETAVVLRGKRAWVGAGGRWTAMPAPGATPAVRQLDFTPYVESVEVETGPLVAGEPTLKIVGVLDTAAFAQGLLGRLGSLPGAEPALVPDVAGTLDDTRMVLYVSETTQLPVRGLVDVAMEAAGERVELHLDFALKGFDAPVRIPSPAA